MKAQRVDYRHTEWCARAKVLLLNELRLLSVRHKKQKYRISPDYRPGPIKYRLANSKCIYPGKFPDRIMCQFSQGNSHETNNYLGDKYLITEQ